MTEALTATIQVDAKPVQLWGSDDNGQIACTQHKPQYGRIRWYRMSADHVAALNGMLAENGLHASCEICKWEAKGQA